MVSLISKRAGCWTLLCVCLALIGANCVEGDLRVDTATPSQPTTPPGPKTDSPTRDAQPPTSLDMQVRLSDRLDAGSTSDSDPDGDDTFDGTEVDNGRIALDLDSSDTSESDAMESDGSTSGDVGPPSDMRDHPDLCEPKTCASENAECGALDDGCGQTIQCGSCVSPMMCGADGQPNQCGSGQASASARLVAHPAGSTNLGYGFYAYTPPTYDSGTNTFPLLLFLHGLGEKGNGTTDLSKILRHGPPKLIRANQWPLSRPFVVIAPQSGSGWFNPQRLYDMIEELQNLYRLDPQRLYLTGLSAGAISSWNYLGEHTSDVQVAAVVPIAGNGNTAIRNADCGFKHIPIWAFHGDRDRQVNPGGSSGPVNHINQCMPPPPTPAKVTIYTNTDHDSWTRTYNGSAGHDIYNWLLMFRR